MHNFDLILKTIESGADLSPNLKSWLQSAIIKWQRGLPVEMAFDVSHQRRIARRNELLRHYAQAHPAKTNWEKTEAIIEQVKRLQCGRNVSPMIEAANKLHKIPCSRRQIFRIITGR